MRGKNGNQLCWVVCFPRKRDTEICKIKESRTLSFRRFCYFCWRELITTQQSIIVVLGPIESVFLPFSVLKSFGLRFWFFILISCSYISLGTKRNLNKCRISWMPGLNSCDIWIFVLLTEQRSPNRLSFHHICRIGIITEICTLRAMSDENFVEHP